MLMMERTIWNKFDVRKDERYAQCMRLRLRAEGGVRGGEKLGGHLGNDSLEPLVAERANLSSPFSFHTTSSSFLSDGADHGSAPSR